MTVSPPRLKVGIQPAFHRVHVVFGDKLPRLAVECRVIGKMDPRLEPDQPRPAAVGNLGHRARRHRRQAGRRAEIVPVVESFEDRGGHSLRRNVGRLLRIEGVDVGRCDAENLVRVGSRGGTTGRQRQQQHRPPDSCLRVLDHASSGRLRQRRRLCIRPHRRRARAQAIRYHCRTIRARRHVVRNKNT